MADHPLSPALCRLIDSLAEQAAADFLTEEYQDLFPAKVEPVRRCCLYRHFNAAGDLLYVGVSFEPKQRRHAHASASPWYREAASMTEEWFDERRAALDAELRAIKSERPRYNVQGAVMEVVA